MDAPENTLLAFLKALTVGVTHLETDVHASADGVAVISHDPDLTRLVGRDVRVSQLTMNELRRIDLGAGQSFCSLAEALDGFPDAFFNIDVKSADAVVPTIGALKDVNAADRVLIGSFAASRRLPVVRALPGVATSVSSRAVPALMAAARAGAVPVARRMLRGIHAVQLPPAYRGVPLLTERSVSTLRDAGVEVHAWTINDASEMDRLLDIGVQGIVTDRADVAAQVVAVR